MAKEFKTVLYEVQDQVLTITMNRPDKLNAVSMDLCYDLIDAVKAGDEDDDVRVIVITGAGRAFCAGADLNELDPNYELKTIDEHRDGGGILALAMFDCKKPIIGAINGPAVGIGMTMTLPMDIRVFSRTGKYGFVFVKRALSPDAASTWFLPRVVGMSRATELMLTGKMFNGDQAYEYGLANYVEEAEDVYPKAMEIAHEIAKNTAPVSVAMARQMLWKTYMYDHPMASHKLDSMCLYHLTHAIDAQEGSQSFFEKRDPEWKMKPSKDMPYFYPWWEERQFPTKLDLV